MLDEPGELSEATRNAVREVVADVERALPCLRPALWPESALVAVERGDLSVVMRPLTAGLAVGLALQLQSVVVTPTAADVDEWGIAREDLFARAVANLRTDERLAVTPEPFLEGSDDRIYTLFEGPSWLASHLLRLDDYLPEAASSGAIVVVPHAGALAFHALGPNSLEAAVRLKRFADRGAARAPRPLSARVYFWQDGAIEPVEIVERRSGPILSGSPALARALASAGLPCETEDALAAASHAACLAINDGLGGALIEVTAAKGGDLPFDPELERAGSAYFVVEAPDGRYLDAFGGMVFESIEELVAANFVAEVAVRRLD